VYLYVCNTSTHALILSAGPVYEPRVNSGLRYSISFRYYIYTEREPALMLLLLKSWPLSLILRYRLRLQAKLRASWIWAILVILIIYDSKPPSVQVLLGGSRVGERQVRPL
jgi:hypothetical protein